MSILVTGGAGYIGSHMAHRLVELGEAVVVLDNLSTGVKQNLPSQACLIEGDFGDPQLVSELIQKHNVESVIHFAGSVVVPESVERPLEYYANNTAAARTLIEVCVRQNVSNFLFSSTAAVYGIPPFIPVEEESATVPVSPYGRSKLMTEWILRDAAAAHDINFGILRYFNVAGADLAGRTGQSTPRATHLIKRACQVATGRAEKLTVFGADYETPDGTGVRDYIHVSDLIDIHERVLARLRNTGQSILLNCGYGRGFSVREVVTAVERISGRTLPVELAVRRAGDLPIVVADTSKLTQILGWTPKYADLDIIIRTALAWENRINEANEQVDADAG
jgi:UDP-glucose 4-epimerase